MINLKELIEVVEVKDLAGDLNKNISGISYDSRQSKRDYLFVAITGFKQDGHKFIEDAINNGANAVIVEHDINLDLKDITVIKVDDSRKALAQLSNKFYGYPSQDLTVIGVTGTNGKTTTTYLIESVLRGMGLNTGLIGTIKNKVGKNEESASRTTPEALDIQRMFAEMIEQGVTHVVMEVSSHALDLDRVLGIEFDRQVFTNLTQDHLDYHNDFKEYLEAKTKLFRFNNNPSIINIDDDRSDYIIQEAQGEVISYGINEQADIMARDIKVTQKSVSYQLEAGGEKLPIELSMTGRFNVYNSLAAIGTIYSLGYDLQQIKDNLEEIEGVPGRFQIIDEGQDFGVIVDYAHTPDSMKNVLKTANEFTKGRKIIVFGCGGDRDQKKRPIMGQIAVTLGDFAIVTSDNPRNEEPEDIIKQIEDGIKEKNKTKNEDYTIIQDRAKGIRKGINLAQSGDIVIIIGKGHETYQVIKDEVISFDDREVARKALQDRGEG